MNKRTKHLTFVMTHSQHLHGIAFLLPSDYVEFSICDMLCTVRTFDVSRLLSYHITMATVIFLTKYFFTYVSACIYL